MKPDDINEYYIIIIIVLKPLYNRSLLLITLIHHQMAMGQHSLA